MKNVNKKFKIEFEKRLINFSLRVIKLCKAIRKDHDLWCIADQLIRSATSIGANIIEAKSSSSKGDYLHFFEIALKSANETHYWLILTKESTNSQKTEVDNLLREINEISKIIAAGILTMKGKRNV